MSTNAPGDENRDNPLKGLPPITVEKIMRWIALWKERKGTWPTASSGEIPDSGGETWGDIARALDKGYRGLPGDSLISKLADKWEADHGTFPSPTPDAPE